MLQRVVQVEAHDNEGEYQHIVLDAPTYESLVAAVVSAFPVCNTPVPLTVTLDSLLRGDKLQMSNISSRSQIRTLQMTRMFRFWSQARSFESIGSSSIWLPT